MASQGVQSVDRVFQLLEQLADEGGPVSLSELAHRSDLPLPTIHRLLRSLTSQGYVRQEASKRYTLGPRMIRLGQSASRMLGSWAQPQLTHLVTTFGETSNMALLENDACVYVAQVPSPRSMRMFTEVGRVVMLHCTGVGKALLSTLPDHQVSAILQRTGMPARTEHTITEPNRMLDALAQIRDDGYAVDDEEQEPGVRCIAVPVPGIPVCVALSVSGPSSRIKRDDIPTIAPDLRAAAEAVRSAFCTAQQARSAS